MTWILSIVTAMKNDWWNWHIFGVAVRKSSRDQSQFLQVKEAAKEGFPQIILITLHV